MNGIWTSTWLETTYVIHWTQLIIQIYHFQYLKTHISSMSWN